MAYMCGRGTRENPLDIDAVQPTYRRPPEPSDNRHSGQPVPRNADIVHVDSDDDVIEASTASAWAEAQKKPQRRPRAAENILGSLPSIPREQHVTTRDASRTSPRGTAPTMVVSNEETLASQLPLSAANEVYETQSENPRGNLINETAIPAEQGSTECKVPESTASNINQDVAAAPVPPPSPYFNTSTRQLSKELCNTPPTLEDSASSQGYNDSTFAHRQAPSASSLPNQLSKINTDSEIREAATSAFHVPKNDQVAPARHHTVSFPEPIGHHTDKGGQTTLSYIHATPDPVQVRYDQQTAVRGRLYGSHAQAATIINERQRARKTVSLRNDTSSKPRRLKRKSELPQQACSQSQVEEPLPQLPSRVEERYQSPQRPPTSTMSVPVIEEPGKLTDATASASMNATIPNQRDHDRPSSQDLPVPRLMIPVDDIERARLAVKNCLRCHLQTRFEAHAYMTSSVLWRQRTCQEREIRAQRRKPSQTANHMQHVSPFKSMRAMQTPHEKKTDTEKGRVFAQEIFTKAKPKDTTITSTWICPLTTYTCNATIVPPFKEYISLNTNLLADNESKLLTTPLILDETDEGRQQLLEELPVHYEMKHDAKGPLDLRNEQCRFYKRSFEGVLQQVGMTWVPILYWLFASNETIQQINETAEGGRQFKALLLDRSRYSIEEFERDGEVKTSVLFDRTDKKCRDLFSKLSTITAEEMRIAAIIGEAVFEECNFSLWYMAQQSDLIREYVRKKTHDAQAEERLTYRQAVCRVCHQHNCLFHGEHREVPDDESDSDSSEDSSQSSNESRAERSRGPDQPPILSLDDGSTQSGDSDDHGMPAHCDSDSDVERVINYKLPMNSVATDTIPKDSIDSIKRRKPPEGMFRADWWQNNYSTLKWNRRKPFYPCKHPGTSCDQAKCRCYRETITCEKSCECSRSCNRRFPGCTCMHTLWKVCADKNRCLCIKFERECDADLCGTCGATHVLDPINRYNEVVLHDRCSNVAIQRGVPRKTLLGQSTVHGFGLYAGEDIKKDDFIGEYKGEVISVQESNRRSTIYGYQQNMYLFGLNKKQDVDATYMGNKLRFINNADKKYTNCSPKNLLCNQVYRIGLFASTNIPAGTELFFNYNYPKELTETFKQPNQAQGSVVAVKNTTITHKAKSRASTSQIGKASSSAVLGQASTATVKVTSAKVIAGLQKARAAKALKAAARLAESQGAILSVSTTLPDRTGPRRARKSVQVVDQSPRHRRFTRVSELRSTRSSRGPSSRASSNASDTPMDNTDDSDSDDPTGSDSRATDVIQNTDDDDEDEEDYIPDTQETQNSTNSYDALFTSRSSVVVEESDDQSIPRLAPSRMRHSAPGANAAPVVAVKRRRKRGGVRPGAGRPKRKRSVVANSDDDE